MAHFRARRSGYARATALRVNFTNSLPALGTNMLGHRSDVTNLHTHGFHVSPLGKSDNVMLTFAPGDSFQFEYDLTLQHPGSFNFYHPHVHGSVAEQYWAGLVGALIIEDPSDVLAGYETHLMILKDITLNGGEPEPHDGMMDYMHGKEGDLVTVNGRVNPELKIAPGQVQRWRILNGSTSRFYHLSLENHNMYIIGTDGGLLRQAVQGVIDAAVARRAVGCPRPGFCDDRRATSFSLCPTPGMGMMTSRQITLLTLSCKGSKANQALPDVVNPEATRLTSAGQPNDSTACPRDGPRARFHQRNHLQRDEQLSVRVAARHPRNLGDRERERNGSPVPPARESGTGPVDHAVATLSTRLF